MTDLVVHAPVAGRGMPLAAVPDPVFAQAMVGPGAAVDPDRTVLDAVAPLDGTLVKLHPHAYVVQDDGGVAVLVHLGIDTVHLGGGPFTVRAREGQRVRAGDVVTTWDVAAVEASGRSPVVPVVVLDRPPTDHLAEAEAVAAGGELDRGDVLFSVPHRA